MPLCSNTAETVDEGGLRLLVGTVGTACVRMLLVACAGALISHVSWALTRSTRAERISRWTMLAMALVVTAACLCLWYLLIREDLRFAYVADYTGPGLPLVYRIAALWAGNAGSLLFWCLMLAWYGCIAAWTHRPQQPDPLQPGARAVLTVLTGFYALLLNLSADPFAKLVQAPASGNGLNPLLQNPGMMVHPVNLYLGSVGFAVPFAYAVAALLHGRPDRGWVIRTRRWTLVSWFFLTVGILYGMRWSYEELGWGGYWAWDPVENASLLPWLAATAYLHTAWVQERQGRMTRWSVILVTLTFLLTLFGTYLTRSGVVWSIHAFANGPLGAWFLALMAVCVMVVGALMIWRWNVLVDERRPTKRRYSRHEAVFAVNNLLMLAAAVAVIWGTCYPILSTWWTGTPRMVGVRFYNTVCLGMGVVVVGLMGWAMVWSGTRQSRSAWVQLWPTALAFVPAGVVAWLLRETFGQGTWLGCLGLWAGLSVVLNFLWDARRMLSRSGRVATLFAVGPLRRRVGAWLAHVAVALITVGIAGSGAFHVDRQVVVAPGGSLSVGGYTLEFTGLGTSPVPGGRLLYANVLVAEHGRYVGALRPGVMFYDDGQAPVTQVALNETNTSDLYLALAGTGTGGSAVLDVHVNPMTVWIWRGGYLLILAVFLCLWPTRGATVLLEDTERDAARARVADVQTREAAPT